MKIKYYIILFFMITINFINGNQLFSPLFLQRLRENYHYYQLKYPFDYDKSWADVKNTFPIVKRFLNQPNRNFQKVNLMVKNLENYKFSPYFPTKSIKRIRIKRFVKNNNLNLLLNYLRYLQEFFKNAKEKLSKKEINEIKNGNFDQLDSKKIYSINKKLNVLKNVFIFQNSLNIMEKIDWQKLPNMDIKNLIYVGKKPKNNYLIIVDKSDQNISLSPVIFDVNLYVKTGSCEEIKGEPATSIIGASYFINISTNSNIYEGKSGMSAILGFSYFEDKGGDDYYKFNEFTECAAMYGISIFNEDSGNDLYMASRFSQSFSSTLGIALFVDKSGNDVYIAGNKVLHEPLYNDQYQSLSQGFSIGDRYGGFGGGISLLVDKRGNDTYKGDVYAQGAGYWYSMGILLDEAGNDNYNAHIYGQGGGIHLAIGILVDKKGNDTYSLLDGVGMGGGHDLAIGILIDEGKQNDAFQGAGITMGSGHANGIGIFYNEGGNDSYAGNKKLIIGDASSDRNTASFGLFMDYGGNDHYTIKAAKNNTVWKQGFVGIGIDRGEENEK